MVAEMEFSLLGPLVVRCAGVAVGVPWGKQRAILATLLLDANRAVGLEQLAEAAWGARQPQSARVTVQNYVKRLRSELGDVGRGRIATQPHGYLISVHPSELDLFRFETAAAASYAAAGNGSWEQAITQAGTALALWRGEPLADTGSDVLVAREVPRLAEMRLQLLETQLDAQLRLGCHTDVIPELLRLVQAYPLRERLHGLLILALFRSGRQGEALAAYQRVRAMLVEELGAEPGAGLALLHQRVLANDPRLAAPPSEPPRVSWRL
jgi:DNA-binding SARP family transcriptional activator